MSQTLDYSSDSRHYARHSEQETTQDTPLIDVNSELEKESLMDSTQLSSDILKIREIHETIYDMISDQDDAICHIDEDVQDSSHLVEESTVEIKESSILQKFKVLPIVIGAGAGAVLCGIPSAFFIGSYSLACAGGGGVLGGILGKTFS